MMMDQIDVFGPIVTNARPDYFTIVFDGRLRDLKANPFKVESPFGKVVAVGAGDALSRQDITEDLLAAAIKARELADHCIDEGVRDLEIGGYTENAFDLSAEFSCAINRAMNAA
jgi:hypothetical protein